MSQCLARIGHNSGDLTIRVSLHLFAGMERKAGRVRTGSDLELPVGATVADAMRHAGVARDGLFLVLVNGRDVSRGEVGGPINLERVLEDGDRLALVGPVPFSWGYGAPIV